MGNVVDINPIRFSHLRAYGRSALHGLYARQGADDQFSYAKEKGTALHALVFGTRKVKGYPGPVRNGKWYDKFCADNPDCEILTMKEFEVVNGMAESVRAHPIASRLIRGTQVEKTLYFDWMGRRCRSTPDVVNVPVGARKTPHKKPAAPRVVESPAIPTARIVELKSSHSAAPNVFPWHARRMFYHAQMRFEQMACAANGIEVADCFIVCVESKKPYPVVVYHLEADVLEQGAKLLHSWMERLLQSESAKKWPGYTERIEPLTWPEDEGGLIFGDTDE